MAKTEVIVEPNSHEVIIIREFDAPPEMVLRAYTEPALLQQWLGPHGSQMIVEHLDARHGGAYRYGSTDEQGIKYNFRGVFHGDPSVGMIVQTFEYEGMPGEISLDKIVLERLDGNRTLLHITGIFTSVAARDEMIAADMERGVQEGYERLDELFVSMVAAG